MNLQRCLDGKHLACNSNTCGCICHGPHLIKHVRKAGPPEEECRARYLAGATITELAREYGCGNETIRKRLNGITLRPGPRVDPDRHARAVLLRRRSEHLPIAELARQEGLDRSYLYRLIRTEFGGIDNWFKGP